MQLGGVGKSNGLVLELNFAGQIINLDLSSELFILLLNLFISLFIHVHLFMIFITQTSTGTMIKHLPQEQMFVIEATHLENHFLLSSGFAMLMLVEDVLIS